MTRSPTRSFFTFLAVSFVAAAAAGYGCGSSSSGSGDAVALCNQYCNKYNQLCAVDAGPVSIMLDCATTCAPTSVSHQVSDCPNASEIIAAQRACLSKTTCEDLTACGASAPKCTGSGNGGASGGAGTTGSAGNGAGGHGGSGAAGTTGAGGFTGFGGFGGNFGGGGFGGSIVIAGTCADLLACCNTASGTAKTSCMTYYSIAMGSGDTACGAVLGQIKATTCP